MIIESDTLFTASLIGCLYIGWHFGAAESRRVKKILHKMLAEIKEIENASFGDKGQVITAKIEVIDGYFYLYDESGSYLVHGKDKQELTNKLVEKFGPEKTIIVTREDAEKHGLK